MKNIIKLSDMNVNDVIIAFEEYTKTSTRDVKITMDNFKTSLNYYLKGNLRYNIKQGKTYSHGDIISSYCYKKDIPAYKNKIEVLENELLNSIICGASRLQRGYNL